MNKLKHALNGNTALQAACVALVGTGLMFLMRRNRMVVVQPTFDTHGTLTGSITTIATPSVPDLAAEGADAATAAAAVGGNIATVITQVREANEAFQRTLTEERETFLRMLQEERLEAVRTLEEERMAATLMLETERRTHEAAVRAAAAKRPKNPKLKVEPLEFYEGDPAEIDTWLRRMTYYFTQVRLRQDDMCIAYAVQRIRKGTQNRAGIWANQIIHEIAMMDEESAAFRIQFPGRAYSREIHRNGTPAEPATAEHEAWGEHIFTHRPPFLTWIEFNEEAK